MAPDAFPENQRFQMTPALFVNTMADAFVVEDE
jgi:hypothetical protein